MPDRSDGPLFACTHGGLWWRRIGSQDFYLDVRYVAVHVVLDVIERLRDDLVGVARVAGDAGDGEGGTLPGVVVIHLGHGDLEALAQPILQTFEDVPLALQGTHVRQVQLDGTHRHPGRRHANAPPAASGYASPVPAECGAKLRARRGPRKAAARGVRGCSSREALPRGEG